MSRWGIENDGNWFIVYRDGVKVASSGNSDRIADVLIEAFFDLQQRLATCENANDCLSKEVNRLRKLIAEATDFLKDGRQNDELG